jgi:hypothetical protein
MQTTDPRRIDARRFRRLTLLATLGLLVVTACAGSARADRVAGWRVGEPHERVMPLASEERVRAVTEADRWAALLDLNATVLKTRRAEDVWLREVSEIVELADATGRIAAIIRIDPATRHVRSVARVDWAPAFDEPRVDAATADVKARAHLRGFGVTAPAAEPTVEWDPGMTAWQVSWARVIDGVSALGDRLTVHVHKGGQLKAFRIFETPHAAAPLFRIEPAQATAAVQRWARSLRLERFAGFRMEPPELAWVSGNGFVDPDKPQLEEPLLRLAYVVRISYRPEGWASDHLTEIYVDAGSGQLIGGAETA